MPVIKLETIINAPIERCFSLASSIDLHMASVAKTSEKAIAGVTTGLIKLNDTVTWEARHLGVKQHLTSMITEFNQPYSFTDEMIAGPFKKLHHQHLFNEQGGVTLMTDIFEFEAPFGIFGKLAEFIFLTRYMRRFLIERNTFLKKAAESPGWQKYTS
jgi:ligand-binding SRPBCC domain-containing protein